MTPDDYTIPESPDDEPHWIRGFGWSNQPGAADFTGWCHGCGGDHFPDQCTTTKWRTP